MRHIHDVLRLYAVGLSKRRIAVGLNIIHNAYRINLDGPSMRRTIADYFNANDVDHAERK